jgi:hypothetical protein
MNYSLGNMLSRGGALNPDGLALDLQFAADKTLTARKGPTPTFTRASTATFVGSDGLIQSAAINTPRFDHDPVTLACRGLLIEESRTNLCLRSEEFNNVTWAKSGTIVTAPVVTADQTDSPSGSLSADRIVFPAVAGVNAFSLVTQFFVQSAGAVHTASVYLRGLSGGEKVWWAWTPNGVTYVRKECVLTTSWQRFNFTYTSVAGNNFVQLGVDLRDLSQSTQPSQTIFAWGAQLETGSFPTSYIPTTTAAVVRSADVCSITGSDFTGFYNQSEGTMLANAFTLASGDRTVLAADDNTANEMIRLRTEGTNPFFKVTDGGSDVVAIDAGTVTANTAFKLIGAYKVNDFASSINGGSAVTDTTGTIPTVDRMRIGAGQVGNTMCGCISAIRYFKKRLPDAKLQSLTT